MTRRALFALAAVFGLRKQVPSPVLRAGDKLRITFSGSPVPFCHGKWMKIPPAVLSPEVEEWLRSIPLPLIDSACIDPARLQAQHYRDKHYDWVGSDCWCAECRGHRCP